LDADKNNFTLLKQQNKKFKAIFVINVLKAIENNKKLTKKKLINVLNVSKLIFTKVMEWLLDFLNLKFFQLHNFQMIH
jgi:predicted transcriptional regulator